MNRVGAAGDGEGYSGGGRGMKAIAAHLRCISKNERQDIEDDFGNASRGKSALHGLAEDSR